MRRALKMVRVIFVASMFVLCLCGLFMPPFWDFKTLMAAVGALCCLDLLNDELKDPL